VALGSLTVVYSFFFKLSLVGLLQFIFLSEKKTANSLHLILNTFFLVRRERPITAIKKKIISEDA
jgi:hypothetical protein